MHDDIPVVEQHPRAVFDAFAAKRTPIEFFQPLFHGFGKAHHMSTRGSGCNEEHIGDDDEPRYVEEDDPQTLLGIDRGGGSLGDRNALCWQRDGSALSGRYVGPHDDRDIDDSRRRSDLEVEQSVAEEVDDLPCDRLSR